MPFFNPSRNNKYWEKLKSLYIPPGYVFFYICYWSVKPFHIGQKYECYLGAAVLSRADRGPRRHWSRAVRGADRGGALLTGQNSPRAISDKQFGAGSLDHTAHCYRNCPPWPCPINPAVSPHLRSGGEGTRGAVGDRGRSRGEGSCLVEWGQVWVGRMLFLCHPESVCRIFLKVTGSK